MPKVSVIVPTFNSARFLPEAIESVLAQTYKDYEIIVVDDGSTDNTREILEPYFDKIKYIYQQNRGEAGARNTGIKHSQGEYIAFLDADDVWLPEKLQIQVTYLDNNPEIAMVYSRVLWISEDGKLISKKSRKEGLPSGNVFNILFLHCFITPSTVMVRKRLLDTVGLFDESLMISTDWDFWLKIAREFKVSGIDKYLCKYRLTPGSLSRKNIETMFKFQKRIIEKHYKMAKDLDRPIAPALYKKALARFFCHVGKHNLKLGKRDAALKNFLESFKYKPFKLKYIRYVLKTIILQIIGGKYRDELQGVQETISAISDIDGWLVTKEGKFLYRTAKNCHKGVIVEIGSFKGKSTIWLAKGSKAGGKVKVYAIDPHTGSPEHGTGWTFPEFTKNIKNANVEDIVTPVIKTSEEAEKAWDDKPVEFLWIDGKHEYEMVKLDFDRWSPHLIDGGIIAFHDTITWPGPTKVVEENIYKSKMFKDVGRVNSITFARKVIRNTLKDRLRNRLLLSNHFLKMSRSQKKSKQEIKEYLLKALKCNPFNLRAIKDFIQIPYLLRIFTMKKTRPQSKSNIGNASNFFIKPGYVIRTDIGYFEDVTGDVVWQPDVYPLASSIGERLGCTHIIDIGCGHAQKLVSLYPKFQIIGVDFGSNIHFCKKNYTFGTWLEWDFEVIDDISIDQALVKNSIIICSDVIEHLINPNGLMKNLKRLLDDAPITLLSTPERDLTRGINHFGPPPNPSHVREWNLVEFEFLLREEDFNLEFVGLTRSNNCEAEKKTILVVLGNNKKSSFTNLDVVRQQDLCT